MSAFTIIRNTGNRIPRTRPAIVRRTGGTRSFQRPQSSSAANTHRRSSSSSHLASGIAGGSIVLLGVYAWYHFSGTKNAVDTFKSAGAYYQQTKDAIVANAPKTPNEALDSLRRLAHSYVAIIPGARPHVDAAFDVIDDLRDTHGDDVNRIVSDGYEEIRAVIRDSGTVDVGTAMKVLDVFRRTSAELEELGKRAGKDAFGALSDKYPQVSEKLGGGYEELRKLARTAGPEAKKQLKATSEELHDIFSKGFSQEGIEKAQRLVQKKVSELQELARSSSQDAYDRALKDAAPYLDKLPEVKQLLGDNAEKLVSAVMSSGGDSSIQEIFARVKDIAQGDATKSKEKISELRELVLQRVHETEEQGGLQLERGWKSLQGWVRAMPGGQEALQRMPDLKLFVKVSQEHGEDAQKLAQETYDEILKVLEEKAKRAKELSERAEKDSRNASRSK